MQYVWFWDAKNIWGFETEREIKKIILIFACVNSCECDNVYSLLSPGVLDSYIYMHAASSGAGCLLLNSIIQLYKLANWHNYH